MSWWGLIVVGLAWVIIVVGTLIVSLVSADQAVANDLADDPESVRTVVAALSGAIFGLPGVIMIVAGLRRWRAQLDPPSEGGR